jgi:hypothetical protein
MTSGEQSRPCRRALRFGAVVREPETLRRERVYPAGHRTAKRAAAVAAQLPEAEIVDVEEEDVRLLSHQVVSELILSYQNQEAGHVRDRERPGAGRLGLGRTPSLLRSVAQPQLCSMPSVEPSNLIRCG